MAGLMDILFGPDGIGGQPGAVGKLGNLAWNGPAPHSADDGLGATVVKSLGNIPKLVTDIALKNPLEILQNPMSVLNDQGQVSMTRLLFPDFRRQKVAEGEAYANAQAARAQIQKMAVLGDVAKMFMEAPTDRAQGELRKGLVGSGVFDEASIQPFANAAKSARHESRQAAAQAGLLPEVANIADVNSAQQAGQSQFSDRLAREQNTQQHDYRLGEIGAQGAETRRNQANSSALAAGNIMLRDRLATARQAKGGTGVGSAEGATATERKGLKSVRSLKQQLRKGQVPDYLQSQAKAAVRNKDGVLAQQVNARMTDAAYSASSPAKLFADPNLRDLAQESQAFDRLQAQLADLETAAVDDKGMLREDLFSPQMAALIPSDPRWQGIAVGMLGDKAQAKQNLLSQGEYLQSNIALAQTGKVANQTEQNRLRVIGPTGNEPSAAIFATKVKAVHDAFERESQIRQEQARAIAEARRAGSSEAALNVLFKERYRSNLSKLMRDLEAAGADPNLMPDVPLTPEQQAEMGK